MPQVNNVFTVPVNMLLFDRWRLARNHQRMVDSDPTHTFQQRFELALQHAGMTRAELAKLPGMGQQNITNWLKRGRIGSQGRLFRTYTGVSIEWLNDNVGDMLLNAEPETPDRSALLAATFDKLRPADQDAVFRLVHSLAESSPAYVVGDTERTSIKTGS